MGPCAIKRFTLPKAAFDVWCHHDVPVVVKKLSQYQEPRFMKLQRIKGEALEYERQELCPLVNKYNHEGELGNCIAKLLGDKV